MRLSMRLFCGSERLDLCDTALTAIAFRPGRWEVGAVSACGQSPAGHSSSKRARMQRREFLRGITSISLVAWTEKALAMDLATIAALKPGNSFGGRRFRRGALSSFWSHCRTRLFTYSGMGWPSQCRHARPERVATKRRRAFSQFCKSERSIIPVLITTRRCPICSG